LFEFDAFGPPSMAFEVLGQEWWQWDAEGHAFEASGGTVWVVVYRQLPPDELRHRFPVIQGLACDHRYLEVADAVAYLGKAIEELEELDDRTFSELVGRLRSTRSSIVDHFHLADETAEHIAPSSMDLTRTMNNTVSVERATWGSHLPRVVASSRLLEPR